MDNYHLVYSSTNEEWVLKKEKTEKPIKNFGDTNKEDAIRWCATYLNKEHGSLKIHLMDGSFEEERTYPRSADPSSSKG